MLAFHWGTGSRRSSGLSFAVWFMKCRRGVPVMWRNPFAPSCSSALFQHIRKAGGLMTGKSRRGFASMDPARQREIASRGGRAAHEKGTAHEWSAGSRHAGRKGAVSARREPVHMAAIGREGGESRSAAARQARLNGQQVEREVPMQVAREGDRSVPVAPSMAPVADRAAATPRSDEAQAH